MQTIDEFSQRLRSCYEDMSPHLKKAAQYLLENPEEVAVHSMRTIAGRAGVHPTTMVRLAKKLSYSGYNDLRSLYQERVKQGRVTHADRAQVQVADVGRSDKSDLLAKSHEAAISSLNATYAELDPATLEAVARMIWRSDHLYIVGFRSDFSVAALFYYRVLLFTPDVSLLDARSSIRSGKLRYIQPGDVMVVIAHEPYSQTALDIVEYAAAKGVDIIAITDSVVSPLTIAAKHAFVLPGVQESGYDYLLPVIALSNLIMSFVIREGGDESVRRLEYSDRDMEEFLSFD